MKKTTLPVVHPLIDESYYIKLSKNIYWKYGLPYYRTTSKFKKQLKNTLAGSVQNNGYRRISCTIDGLLKNLLAHRVCYYMETGELPKHIKHLDDNKDNNRLSNLKASGYKGVIELTTGFQAFIYKNKEYIIYLDVYPTDIEAAKARDAHIVEHGLDGLSEYTRFNFHQGKRKLIQSKDDQS